MDLSSINANNVHQLAVHQIEQIISCLFSAEEWSNMSQFEKTRYRILFVVYIQTPEFQRTKTLEEFIKEKTGPPPEALSELYRKRQFKEENVSDSEDSSFKVPSAPKKKCVGNVYTEHELYSSTGTFLAPKRQTVPYTEEIPSTSGLQGRRDADKTESVIAGIEMMEIDSSDEDS